MYHPYFTLPGALQYMEVLLTSLFCNAL